MTCQLFKQWRQECLRDGYRAPNVGAAARLHPAAQSSPSSSNSTEHRRRRKRLSGGSSSSSRSSKGTSRGTKTPAAAVGPVEGSGAKK
jgi:hypothetical protein